MGKNILTKELLLRSVAEWNAVREAYPDLKPDLSEADLSKADLYRANLRHANLIRANLNGADLSEADLSEANLMDASLMDANLTMADLIQAKLIRAKLRNADITEANLSDASLFDAYLNGVLLRGATLSNADLSGACLYDADIKLTDLDGANLSWADIGFTTFGDVDLSKTIGLDTVRHASPSIIGIDTIYKSNGKIPELFLRRCGVPENFIEYARSLTATAFDYYSCFISYSHRDEEFARRLHTDLQANNVRCWFAPHDLPIGAKTRPTIDDAIRIHDKLLLILSEHSVQSDWVEHEVEHALDLEKERGKLVLFPVRLDDTVMDSKTGWASNVKRQRNIGDFTKWKDHDAYQEAFSRLLRDMKHSDKPNK